MMISRRELESILGYKLTDDAWKETCKALDAATEKQWNEDHPLDE